MVLTTREHGHGRISFTVDGRPVTGLYPGAVKRIKLSVVNPLAMRLTLESLTGKMVGTSRRRCPATPASLRVNDYAGPLPVLLPPRSRTELPGFVSVTMPVDATPKCADTEFVISLRGLAARVPR